MLITQKGERAALENKKMLRNMLFYIGIPILIIIFIITLFGTRSQKTEAYSDIIKYFKDQQVTEYSMNLGTGEMKLKLKDNQEIDYTAPNVLWLREDIKQFVDEYNNNNPDAQMKQNLIRASENSWWSSILLNLLTFVGLGLVWWFVMRKMMSGLGDGGKTMTFGKAKV